MEEIICDSNYSSGQTLAYLEQENVTGYIPAPGQYKKEREGFIYHTEGDYYTCVQGAVLSYKNTYADVDGYLKKEYRSNRQTCKRCPLRKICLGRKGKEKKLSDTIDKTFYDRMETRMQTPKGERMKKLRQSTVEPVIGTLVNYLGMRKINTIGIKQANKCMLMAAVAYNLKKMIKSTSTKMEIGTMVMKKVTNLSRQFIDQINQSAFCKIRILKF